MVLFTLRALANAAALRFGELPPRVNRYQPNSGRIQLLGFGAVREYSPTRRTAFRSLLDACIAGDDSDLAKAAAAVGYVDETDPAAYRNGIIALLRCASEPARARGSYHFGTTDLDDRMRDQLVRMRLHDNYWRMLPVGVLFLHRKLGGMYLLLKRLGVEVAVSEIVSTLDLD